MATVLNFLSENLKTFNLFSDTLDIILVTLIVYFVLRFVKETQAAPLMKGIVLLIAVWGAADALKMNVTSYIIRAVLEFGVLAIIIIFQPEIRALLERFGRTKLNLKTVFNSKVDTVDLLRRGISVICSSCASMSATKTGALIIVEGATHLGDIVNTGTVVDAAMSDEMVKNIFYPKAPLHDGAAVVRDGRIVAAGCVLPLTKNQNLSSELGTRHRAAIGMSELADCAVVVVSEETGYISVAQNGSLKRDVTTDELRNILIAHHHLDGDSVGNVAKNLFGRKEK